MVIEEQDMVKEDAVGRARELHVASASLANAKKREKVIREAYGEMSVLAY